MLRPASLEGSRSGKAEEPAEAFRPAWWCRGRHMQTLCARFLRPMPEVEVCRARWTTPDGDFLDIDFVDGPVGSPLLLVLHGLEGCSERAYVRGFLSRAEERGWRAAAPNFRSCSGTPNRGPRLYHSGDSADLDWVVRQLLKRHPGAPILPVGISLGGNVLLKWLGEQGSDAPDEVRAGVGISTPFDLRAGSQQLGRGLGRLYTRYFLRKLKSKALTKAKQFPGLLETRRIRRARTWREYDDAVTAPLHGFRDAGEYWRECSSKYYLADVRRPVLLINSHDDPFLPVSALPHDLVERSPWLRADFTPRGGHAGFVSGPWPWRPRYWAETRALDFLERFVPSIRPARVPPLADRIHER